MGGVDARRVALVHDWLTFRGGAENVLEVILSLIPGAPVHTLVYNASLFTESPIARADVRTSFLQRLPGSRRHYRLYLPLMPMAVEQFDLAGFDLILSMSDAVAHGVLTAPDQLHINYILTPMRYAWPLYHEYLRGAGLTRGPRSWLARSMLHYLRLWDLAAAGRVDQFIAISRWVAARVWRYYRRQAEVIYPPVAVERFHPFSPRDSYYITVSRLVPYKRVDLIVEAFNRLNRVLLVVGEGPGYGALKSRAGPEVRLLGRVPDGDLVELLGRARAFIFAAEEDFGIAPVEAMAAGCPVIAWGRGGVLETVVEGKTGVFFNEPTVEGLMEAVERFEVEESAFRAPDLQRHAARFSRARFERDFLKALDRAWVQFEQAGP